MCSKYAIALPVVLLIVLIATPVFCETAILNIRHWAAPEHTRIVIDTSDEADIKIAKDSQGLSIVFRDATFPEDLEREMPLNVHGLQKILVSDQAPQTIQVRLELKDGAVASVFRLREISDKPFRVVIDLSFPELEKKASEERQQFKAAQKDKIIVIDPGHGGEDPGAIGPSKTMEKDVVLAIAKKLQWLLNHRKGYRAFLTRDDDYYPSFKKRLQIAREYGADLFISIHADAARSRAPQGTSVYVLSTNGASNAAARLLARQENLADIVGGSNGGTGSDESDPITLNMLQTETINMSKSFGRMVLDRVGRFNPIKFANVQEAPFIVLKLPHIPSILVETGYITNLREEKRLTSNRHQNRVSLALSNAIQYFLRDPEPDDDAFHIALNEAKDGDEADDSDGKNEDKAAKAPPRQVSGSKPLPKMIIYTVKKGETIQGIADKFDLSVDELIKLNHLGADKPLTKHYLKVYLTEKEPSKRGERSIVKKSDLPPEKGKSAGKPTPEKTEPYVVKNGDTLAKIAERFDTTTQLLCRINAIDPAAPLFVGKKLAIPCNDAADEKKAVSKSAFAPQKQPAPYIVKKGDTLAKIAEQCDLTVNALCAINKLDANAPLLIGQKIRLAEFDDRPEKAGRDKTAAPVSDKPIRHLVQRGDNLAKIAAHHHCSVQAICQANKIKASASLYVGRMLTIPVAEADRVSEETVAPHEEKKTPPRKKLHVVKQGDSLAKIAQKYDIPLDTLLKANGMRLKDPLFVGRKVKIPDKSDKV